MTRTKICGLTTHGALQTAVSAGADAVGLVCDVETDTPREIPPELAVELSRAAPPFVTTVLVTMPATPDDAVDLAARLQPDVVQVHGEFTVGDLAYLSANVSGDVMAAVTPEAAADLDTVADALVVDSLDDAGAGGTGETHDWEATRDLVTSLSSPIVLAGGLTPANVADAVDAVGPFAVDVASGVEAAPGRKDPGAVAAFVRAAGGRP
jgi:phosphoribosylanthranilate isomerase